jgi:hypothetical protein
MIPKILYLILLLSVTFISNAANYIIAILDNSLVFRVTIPDATRAARKLSSCSEYLDNRSLGLDVTWHPIRGDLTVHP